MHILIIGGSRFVGQHLVEMLRLDHQVTVFNRGRVQVRYPERVRFIQGDRDAPFTLQEHFDTVIDMVSYNGEQTARALKQLKFDFFLHFGTAAVYQKSELFPLSEESALGDWPVWGAYNQGKVECEKVLAKSSRHYASIRPVYVLGPNNYIHREEFLYAKLKKAEPILVPGSGEALVQFVFAKEVAASMALLATKQLSGVYNCAGQECITLNGLVEAMSRIVGKKALLKHNPEADGEMWNEGEFPFANEHFFCRNEKLQALGIKFGSLLEGLQADYTAYYSKKI